MDFKRKLTVGALLAGGAVFTLHMINRMFYLSATLDNLMGEDSGSFYEWRFGKIYYTVTGKGSPIVLIHDMTTFSSACEWDKVRDKLSKSHTVYCIDLLGCGRSDKPNITYTNYLYVGLITDFIKLVVGNTCDIIASGESVSFTLAACHNDDEIVNRVLLINPAGIRLFSKIPSKRSKSLTLLINTPIIGTFIYNLFTRKKDVQSLFELDYFYDSDKIDTNVVNTFYESAHTGNASSKHLFASMAGYYTTVNIPRCLETLTNSIFIITGEETSDNEVYAKEYQKILPAIELTSIPMTKHLPHLENPDAFLDQVNIFLHPEQ